MKRIPADFAEKLKQLRVTFERTDRDKPGLSLRELSHRSGIHYTQIADYESGRRHPSQETLEKLGASLGLSGKTMDEFIAEGRENARLDKSRRDFPLVPGSIQRRLMVEISKALKRQDEEEVTEIFEHPVCDLLWVSDGKKWHAVELVSAVGKSEKDALRKLSSQLSRKAEQVKQAITQTGAK